MALPVCRVSLGIQSQHSNSGAILLGPLVAMLQQRSHVLVSGTDIQRLSSTSKGARGLMQGLHVCYVIRKRRSTFALRAALRSFNRKQTIWYSCS